MLKTIILAGGQGSRMKSKIPKVLHKINNKYLVEYTINVSKAICSDKTIVVVGYERDMVMTTLKDLDVDFAIQENQLGTGDAVKSAINYLDDNNDGHVLILYGDCPLVTANSIEKLIETHKNENNDVTCISAFIDDPSGYGRIVRVNNEFKSITEDRDCTEEEKKIKETNMGIYCFKESQLIHALDKLTTNNNQGEYYLTDSLEILKKDNKKVGIFIASSSDEFVGINSKSQLAETTEILRKKINKNLMDSGVIMLDPNTTYIDDTVNIGMDTVIYPNTIISGNTSIGEDCTIGPNTTIENSNIGNDNTIKSSFVLNSKVENNTNIGPFAYIRPNSSIGNKCKIGDFVEIKNTRLDDGSKASHLTYIGDAEVGKNVNFGCGTITVNYDGKNKSKTIIGDNSFIGCNSNLIAPVKISNDTYVAAGTTVTKEVPEKSLVIGRVRQEIKKNWIK